MAILGVLLGITMTILACLIRDYLETRKAHGAEIKSLAARVEFLEKRKALLAEVVASQPKPAGVGATHGATRIRTWNEDAPYVEKAKS